VWGRKFPDTVSEPAREGALLDLLFAHREGLEGDVMVAGSLGHSDHEMVEISILREGWGLAESPPWTSRRQTLACL